MKAVELLRMEAELAYADFLETLDGVTEAQAWAILPHVGTDYLNTDASIQGVTLHVATCKRIYGSVAFRQTETRWRDCANELEGFEPSWIAAREYLEESQRYWLSTWETRSDDDLERDVPHFSGKMWPAWKIIRMVTHHDSYHAGQIAVFRYGSGESATPPMSVAQDLRNCCPDLSSW